LHDRPGQGQLDYAFVIFAAERLRPCCLTGSAEIEAVTNILVKESNTKMLIVLYSTVVMLCFITFRSWRAVVIAVLPLIITSLLCEALMVWLGIGIKVATLPVIALGVGAVALPAADKSSRTQMRKH
jgi:predicted RND superfamily exporter protein